MSRLIAIVESVAGSLLAVMAALVIYQVAGRYLFGRPPSWTEELARYLQVWLVLLAAPACLARGMHLSVDYLTPKLPERSRRIVRTAVLVLVGLFSAVLAVYGVKLLAVAALQVSPALGISMVWPYLALPVSGFLMSLVSVVLLFGSKELGSPTAFAGRSADAPIAGRDGNEVGEASTRGAPGA